jgi:hypothetical protein
MPAGVLVRAAKATSRQLSEHALQVLPHLRYGTPAQVGVTGKGQARAEHRRDEGARGHGDASFHHVVDAQSVIRVVLVAIAIAIAVAVVFVFVSPAYCLKMCEDCSVAVARINA